jgi:hypothetical protein
MDQPTMTPTLTNLNLETAKAELRRLGLYGLAAHVETRHSPSGQVTVADFWFSRVILPTC